MRLASRRFANVAPSPSVRPRCLYCFHELLLTHRWDFLSDMIAPSPHPTCLPPNLPLDVYPRPLGA